MSLRVLVITPLFPPAVGGAASYFGDLVAEMGNQNSSEQLLILTEKMPGQPITKEVKTVQLLRRLPNRISSPQRSWQWHAVSYLQTQLWFLRYLPGMVQQNQIDLIHYHTRYRGGGFYRALRKTGVSVLADMRDKLGDVEQLVGTVSRLMCCSEGVKQFAENAGFPSDRIELVPITFVPTTPPTEVQQAATRQLYQLGTEPFLLFVGDITANKGVYDLLAAYLEWSKVNPRIPLLLAGVNREGQNFTQEVAKVKGARYLGSIPHIDALGLMAQAEVLLLPSRSEGLPRTILEAISLGTKVVCPPNIPEFERYLPEWTLPEVSPQAILNTLMQVWHTKSVPSYPFEVHALDHIVQQVTRIYHDLGTS